MRPKLEVEVVLAAILEPNWTKLHKNAQKWTLMASATSLWQQVRLPSHFQSRAPNWKQNFKNRK